MTKPDTTLVPPEPGVKKRRWESMKLVEHGNLGTVIQGGGGKLTPSGGDPGENRKPPGSGA